MKKRSKKSTWLYVVIGLVIVAMLLPMTIRLMPNNTTTNKPPADNMQTETPDDGGGGTTDEDHIHVYDKMETIPIAHKSLATCTTPDVYYLSCACGKVSMDPTLVFTSGTALGHNYVNGICSRCNVAEPDDGGDDTTGGSNTPTVDPETCSHEETKEAYVSRTVLEPDTVAECGHEQHYKCVVCTLCEKILSRDYSSSEDCTWYTGVDFDMTCDICGCVNGHTVVLEYVVKEDGYHYRSAVSCSVCQEYFPQKVDACEYVNGVCVYCKAADPNYTGVDTHVHAFVQQIRTGSGKLAKAATCYTPNSYYYSCICGEVGTETFYFGEPLEHIYADGICQFCGVEQNHVHVFDQQNTDSKYSDGSAATCTSPAFYYYSCVCGEAGSYTFPYPTATGLGHVYVTTPAQAPSCESYGWYEYQTCSREGCDYTTYNPIPATGHTYVNGVCTTCQAVNPNYEQVDAFANHQPVLNADQTAFEWSGNWTLGDLDASGNYREFNTVHQDYNDTAHKWLIYTPDVV
ncbi:MAG: hypothetical protein IJ012_05785, partial [Clostridia bacterium]|nr:hypothetical protein [Clostridia bacterium]